MGITNISFGNITDIVFENRNRQYGAYVLRSQYSNRLLIACISGIAIILLLVSSPLIANLFRGEEEIIFKDYAPDAVLPPPTVVPIKDEIKPNTGPKPPMQKGAAIAGKPVDNNDTLNDDRQQADPMLALGDPNGVDIDPLKPIEIPEGPVGNGQGTITVKKDAERYADVMPEFDGDYRRWLSSHLSYPAIAKDMGVQGTVYVEFIVDEEGNVTNAKLLKDIGQGCGEAALKAVRSMPKWKPGIKKGEKVRVYYTLPVKFSLR